MKKSITIETEKIKLLTAAELQIYCIIKTHHNEYAVPSTDWIIQESGKSRASVFRTVATLKNKGVI